MEFVERMSLLLQKADFLCGHAVGNDLSSLARCFRSVGKDISKLTLGARIIDTADFGSLLLGIPNQTSLQHTGELLGVPQDGRAFHKADVDVDYTGFTIPDEFVVGFGLDYDQKYRNLPYIGVVENPGE